MPKLIDHDERKKIIAAAVWKIIGEQGIGAISIRNVAAEAGISTGSLRHSFDSRLELVAYAMQLINEQIEDNVRTATANGLDVLTSVRILENFIPLNHGTTTIARVTLGMIAEMRSTPEIFAIAQESRAKIRTIMRDMFIWLYDNHELKLGVDVEAQTDQLLTLSYGLTTKSIVGGDRTDPVYISKIFRSHVNRFLVHPVPYATAEELNA